MPLTYREAGVDVQAGRNLVDRIKPAIQRTRRNEIIENPEGFAALTSIPSKFKNPVLVSGTDGVGTKIDLLLQHDRIDTVGFDLVAMCVNDILVYGAEPFIFLDYYASSKLDIDVAERVIVSIARACELAGCALVGGETAEMPGFYPDQKFDLAGFCVGLVEKDRILNAGFVEEGDVLIGLSSSGAHSNGFSLIRRLLADGSQPSPEVLEQLLAPTEIYVSTVLPIIDHVSSIAHITGGGFGENLPRAFGESLSAEVDLDTWTRHECFKWLQGNGQIEELEMLNTFNCGIGLVLFCKENQAEVILKMLEDSHVTANPIGRMVKRSRTASPGHLVVSRDSLHIA